MAMVRRSPSQASQFTTQLGRIVVLLHPIILCPQLDLAGSKGQCEMPLFPSVSTDLEVEKVNCKELKKTWEMANAHFIVSQDKLKQEIYRLQQKLERGEAVR